MSFHGAVVITNLLGAIPIVGESITTWLWGGFAVDNPTLNRFFALHYLFPFIIAGIVGLHIWALHVPGNNNPVGILIPQDLQRRDTLPFHPYYTVKDGFAIVLFLILFSVFVFFNPNALGHADNYIPANPLVTPAHIVPEWYLLPFYAILRAVDSKFGGVLLMFGAIAVIFLLPWLDTSKVRSTRYRPTAKIFFWIFVGTCLVLGWCGAQLPDDMVFTVGERADGSAIGMNYVWLTRIVTAMYFAYFLIVLPLLGLVEKPLPIPPSISAPVLSHAGGDGGDGGMYTGHNPAPAPGYASRPATAQPETRG
jgi:ubiquinol-cytochrome c reductase cytochrome b subunit